VKNVEMVGWTAAEELAERGCCDFMVTAAFFVWSFLVVRPVVAVCGRGGRPRAKNKGTYVQSFAPMPHAAHSHAL
jgi:hypothetical protein